MVEGRGNAWRAPLEVQYMCPGLCLSLSVYVRLCFCEYTSVCVSVLVFFYLPSTQEQVEGETSCSRSTGHQ